MILAQIENDAVTTCVVAQSVAYCVNAYGGEWLETRVNGSIRGIYAGIDYAYDRTNNVFVAPPQEPPGPPRP